MIPEEDASTREDGSCLNGNFLCGVVEGFYGKPWSTEQRKKLFRRMKKMGMNTYLYAPKDDCKHRMFWRDLYSVEEAEHLTNLIENAKESSVDFVYALSPGLDITFASSKDVMHLKRKLEQVANFGCKSFALLFDDIEVEMCEADKAVFQSFAHAQVSVSNETYQYLGQPKFLFCPTEYCATRAVPDVPTSEYLTTIGAKLLPGIDILWTGPRVISKYISVQSIEEVSKVLQRPPVIWDNIHANDYDPKRVYLGPYDGRLPELIPYLNGVLTNPNCEFEANFVAMHTLAQWSRSNVDGMKKDIVLSSSPVTADIKLETENCTEDDDFYLHSSYHPQRALEAAVTDWLDIIHSECREPKKPVPVVKPPLSLLAPPGTTDLPVNPPNLPQVPASSPMAIPNLLAQAVRGVDNINELTALAEVNESLLQPTSVGPMNSLIDSASSDSEDGSVGEPSVEPMDCVVTPGSSPVSTSMLDNVDKTQLVDNYCTDCKSESSDTMQVEISTPVEPSSTHPPSTLTHEEMRQLVDLFYLPLDHGSKALALLNDFCWIRGNAQVATEARLPATSTDKQALVAEWERRCHCFQNNVTALMDLMDRFCNIPNKAVVHDLFPYMWDLHETLGVVATFVKWLVMGAVPVSSLIYTDGPLWSNKGYRDAFLCGDHEPWFFRGGLQAEFQNPTSVRASFDNQFVFNDGTCAMIYRITRLIAVEGMGDLLVCTPPAIHSMLSLNIRSYVPLDESAVYNVCRKIYSVDSQMCSDYPDLIGDRTVGSMLALKPELSFVVEHPDSQLAGYVFATLDAKKFAKKSEVMWNMAMQTKYPKPEGQTEESLTASQRMMRGFYVTKALLPDCMYEQYPARMTMGLLPQHILDLYLARRTMLFTLAALKASGCRGVHVEVPKSDRTLLEFYAKLGFFHIQMETISAEEDISYMGRNI